MDTSSGCKFWVFILCFWLENGRGGTLLEIARRCERRVENEVWHTQKLEIVCRKKSSCKFYKIYRKTNVPESLFSFFLCFAVNFAEFVRTPFLQNISRRLLPDARNRYRSSHRRCSIKMLFLKISQYSQENICVGVSF